MIFCPWMVKYLYKICYQINLFMNHVYKYVYYLLIHSQFSAIIKYVYIRLRSLSCAQVNYCLNLGIYVCKYRLGFCISLFVIVAVELQSFWSIRHSRFTLLWGERYTVLVTCSLAFYERTHVTWSYFHTSGMCLHVCPYHVQQSIQIHSVCVIRRRYQLNKPVH